MVHKGNNHDYDIVYNESLLYFEQLLAQNMNLNIAKNIEKARLGFYYLVFELLFDKTQIYDVENCIIDDNFVTLISNQSRKNKDLGIDAVYIDENEKNVHLLNFKFREKYIKSSKKPKYEEIRSAETFLNIVLNPEEYSKFKQREDIDDYQKTLSKIDEIINLVGDDSAYNFILHMVTNDNSTIDESDLGTRAFLNQYDFLELRDFNLPKLMEGLSLHSPNNKATIVLENKSILDHNVEYTKEKSYIVELDLISLIRISGDDIELRQKNRIEDPKELDNIDLDFDLLFDNVREYLGDNKINKKIIKTLSEEPSNFFLFNNGLTIVAEEINSRAIPINKSTELTLKNYQIVNGGQTLRSIFKYKTENEDEQKVLALADASVLVRLLVTSKDEELTSKISEYTNSQNPIKEIDLRSVDKIQLKIERRLEQEGIQYRRKRGGGKPISKKYNQTISMEKLGQILFAYEGRPEAAANSKTAIFSNYYEKIFNEDPELLDRIIKQIGVYSEIGKEYKNKKYEYYEQKAYYVLFMRRCLPKKSLGEIIDILETILKSYVPEKETTEARKFLQPKFKEEVLKKINNLGGQRQGIFLGKDKILLEKKKEKSSTEKISKLEFWKGFSQYIEQLGDFNYKIPQKDIASYYTVSGESDNKLKCEFSVGAKTIGFIYGKKADKTFFDFLVLNKDILSKSIGKDLTIRVWNEKDISNVQGLKLSIKGYGLNYQAKNIDAYKILIDTFLLLDDAVQKLINSKENQQ